MKTPFRNGIIDIRLTKPETAMLKKVFDKIITISKMRPINMALAGEASKAAEGLAGVLKLAGCDAVESYPLFDDGTAQDGD